MRSIISALCSALLLLTACGDIRDMPAGSTEACDMAAVGTVPPVPVPATRSFVLMPDYGIDLGNDYWASDAHGIVISDPSMSQGPALIPGKVSGQSYVALPSACTAQTADALAALFAGAAPISAPISNAALGLVKGVQLPHQGCVVIANCDGSICTDQALTLTFQ